jgi:NDP-sugar pyrophosphorylase family protein
LGWSRIVTSLAADSIGVVLAGGQGTRLQSVIGERQKVMAEVAGQPFLEMVITHLLENGLDHVVLSLGFGAGEVRQFFDGHRLSKAISYSIESVDRPLGTGGALRAALKQVNCEDVVVANGDTFCELSMAALLKSHRDFGAIATIAISEAHDLGDYAAVEIDMDNRVVAFREKERRGAGYASMGRYVFARKTIAEIPEGRAVSLELEVLPRLVGKALFAFRSGVGFHDIGTPERYRRAAAMLGGHGA